jgi:WD40 repeat protein
VHSKFVGHLRCDVRASSFIDQHGFVTGGQDGDVCRWDLRYLGTKLESINISGESGVRCLDRDAKDKNKIWIGTTEQVSSWSLGDNSVNGFSHLMEDGETEGGATKIIRSTPNALLFTPRREKGEGTVAVVADAEKLADKTKLQQRSFPMFGKKKVDSRVYASCFETSRDGSLVAVSFSDRSFQMIDLLPKNWERREHH